MDAQGGVQGDAGRELELLAVRGAGNAEVVCAVPVTAPITSSSSATVTSAIAQAAFALTNAVTSMASSNQPLPSFAQPPPLPSFAQPPPLPSFAQPPPSYHPPSYHPPPSHPPPAQSSEPPPKRAKTQTRAKANSRACKWRCMCKTEEQQRMGERGGKRVECIPACPKFAWMRDPGWPNAPTIPNEPAVGLRCSYLPSSGKEGMIEYRGRNEWSSVI